MNEHEYKHYVCKTCKIGALYQLPSNFKIKCKYCGNSSYGDGISKIIEIKEILNNE